MARGPDPVDMTARVGKLDPPPTSPWSLTDFALAVSILGGKPERFIFDKTRLQVGRAREADLRVEHACIARDQFAIERSMGAGGEPRFRIVPTEAALNPTYVNGQHAVEGALKPGDLIAVGEVRMRLERVSEKERAAAAAAEWHPHGADVKTRPGGSSPSKSQLSPLRMVLIALTVGMAAVVAYLFLWGEVEEGGSELTTSQTPLFGTLREPHCANPMECDAKAHDSYERARKLNAAAAADPGNLYRSALEFARARSYREQSGRPLVDIADVGTRADNARRAATDAYDEARFALNRAIANHDKRRAAAEAARLTRLVPDENHPYRIQLDAYRRELPIPKQ